VLQSQFLICYRQPKSIYFLSRDPNVIESKVMVSSTGHDGPMGASGVKRLARLGMLEKPLPGMAALDMNAAEDAVVDRTREVVPGMVICGMEVAELDGCPRMVSSHLSYARLAASFLAIHIVLHPVY